MNKEKLVIEFDKDVYCILFNSLELKLLGFSDRFLVCEDLKTGMEFLISKCRFDEIKARDEYGNITILHNQYYKQKLEEYREFEKTISFWDNFKYFTICGVDVFYNAMTYPFKCVKFIIRRIIPKKK